MAVENWEKRRENPTRTPFRPPRVTETRTRDPRDGKQAIFIFYIIRCELKDVMKINTVVCQLFEGVWFHQPWKCYVFKSTEYN